MKPPTGNEPIQREMRNKYSPLPGVRKCLLMSPIAGSNEGLVRESWVLVEAAGDGKIEAGATEAAGTGDV